MFYSSACDEASELSGMGIRSWRIPVQSCSSPLGAISHDRPFRRFLDWDHDVLHTTGPVDHLDHSAYQQFWGGKMGIDATAKLPGEGYARDGGWPPVIVQDPAVIAKVTGRWKELGL